MEGFVEFHTTNGDSVLLIRPDSIIAVGGWSPNTGIAIYLQNGPAIHVRESLIEISKNISEFYKREAPKTSQPEPAPLRVPRKFKIFVNQNEYSKLPEFSVLGAEFKDGEVIRARKIFYNEFGITITNPEHVFIMRVHVAMHGDNPHQWFTFEGTAFNFGEEIDAEEII